MALRNILGSKAAGIAAGTLTVLLGTGAAGALAAGAFGGGPAQIGDASLDGGDQQFTAALVANAGANDPGQLRNFEVEQANGPAAPRTDDTAPQAAGVTTGPQLSDDVTGSRGSDGVYRAALASSRGGTAGIGSGNFDGRLAGLLASARQRQR